MTKIRLTTSQGMSYNYLLSGDNVDVEKYIKFVMREALCPRNAIVKIVIT